MKNLSRGLQGRDNVALQAKEKAVEQKLFVQLKMDGPTLTNTNKSRQKKTTKSQMNVLTVYLFQNSRVSLK
ncbi:CLUMA_CG011672, isoform A, partial [Clunio marinus]